MALNAIPIVKSVGLSGATATAGTHIKAFIPPVWRRFTKIVKLRYTTIGQAAATTTHLVTIQRSLGTTTFAANANAGQLVFTLASITPNQGALGTQPNAARAIAANDWLVWENNNAGWDWGQVASVSGATVTMTASTGSLTASGLPVAVSGPSGTIAPNNLTFPYSSPNVTTLNLGGRVWLMGLPASAFGTSADNQPNFQPTPGASGSVAVDTTYGDDASGWVGSVGSYEPLIFDSNNVTIAGIIQELDAMYTSTN